MKTLVRWLIRILAILVSLVLIAAIAIFVRARSMMNVQYSAPQDAVVISTDTAAMERGAHLAKTVSVCVDCHGEDLSGGVVVSDSMIGYVAAPNLTKGKGGLAAELNDEDMVRVLRYGVLPDGYSVRIMPSDDYHRLSDQDLGAIIAYVRSVPPVDKEWPALRLGPLGRVLFALGQLPILVAQRIDFNQTPLSSIQPEISPAYGEYLAKIAGCLGCHNASLSGGPILAAPPDWPEASNLTPGGKVGKWSEEQFITTIRSGVNPTGKALNPVMPWPRYGQMTDEELKALWSYIKTVPAKEYAVR